MANSDLAILTIILRRLQILSMLYVILIQTKHGPRFRGEEGAGEGRPSPKLDIGGKSRIYPP